MFKPIFPKVDFPKLEKEILKYWKKNKIFEKSLSKNAYRGNWTFLDGPPFITGLPHYGSLLSSLPKDLFPRFKTMQGYRVRRVWGWDCHGLPAENKVEELLGVKRKRDIEEKIGVKRFINECKRYVSKVSSEWEWYVDHIGRWVDFKNAYKTMDLSYMESVMWVFKQMYDKGLIYKGLRVLHYCPHCATPISNFEVSMDADNYKMLPDPSTTYKYELRTKNQEQKTYILAWSTTPWNKIVTTALAVNPKLTYVEVRQGSEYYILAKSTLKRLRKQSHPELGSGSQKEQDIVSEFKGKDLIGKKFIPHYDYYKIDKGKKAFEIIGGDFVTAEEGTGIVTIAAYGEEDLPAMLANNIHIEMHLDDEGMIKSIVPSFGGMYYLKTNKIVNEDLKKRGLIYQDKEYLHSVPTCWRCNTRLYQAPQNAWYVNVQKLKPQMKKTNEKVKWFPKHFKLGRFLKSLEKAPDWNISRNRYWGSPVPVWECQCGERFVPGSIRELEEKSGQKVLELHKPEIDEITITCDKCNRKVYRVLEVLDSWIEAGSAPFGERHYPFKKGLRLEEFFPPDFIGEYTGQIRAWFYVLHVVSNALKLRKDGLNMLSKNVVVEGVILGTDGRKMSKNYNNYPDPKELIQKYGGDALRLYLLSSPVMKGEDILISEEQYRNQVKGMMLILWNVYNFFITYANIDKWSFKEKLSDESLHWSVLDNWIDSVLNRLIKEVSTDLEQYDTVSAIEKIKQFINSLSTWYIRRSRERLGPTSLLLDRDDKISFYQATYSVLVNLSKLLAPFTPFLAEEIYKNLTNHKSVHLSEWPKYEKNKITDRLEEMMANGIELASVIHGFRKEKQIKVKIPLKVLEYNGPEELDNEIKQVVLDEVNVENLVYKTKNKNYEVFGDVSEKNQDIEAGKAREIVRQIQEERKKLGTKLDEKVNVILPEWPRRFEEDIKRKALISKIKKGEKFLVTRE